MDVNRPKRPCLMIVHQQTSVTGRVGAALEQRGYPLHVCCPMANDDLPRSLSDYSGVCMFGGPMSANDDHLPGIRSELNLLDRIVAMDIPFLGICLGAQLLARVLGGKVYTRPDGFAEIGYYPIYPTSASESWFRDSLYVYQWHREGIFDLPATVTRLATSSVYDNQAFRTGNNVYGVQFHPDVTRQMMARWLNRGAERLKLPGARPVEQHLSGYRQYDALLNQWLNLFLDQWLMVENHTCR